MTGNILVVEQNDISRKLITGILGKRGYTVLEASSGAAAIGYLAQDIRAAVLDAESDDAAGLAKKLQNGMTLILMTDNDDHAAVKKRLGTAKASVLQKPVMPDALVATIEAEAPKPAVAPLDNTPSSKKQRDDFMRRAVDLSQEKMDANAGGPFGAVIVKGGKIIAEGWNCVTSDNDPTAHAEMVAIRRACAAVGDFNLSGCEIYTSCEPCPMCLSALYWARVDRIFYGNTREDAAKIGFDDDLIYRELAVDMAKRSLPAQMMLREEAKIVFENWMKKSDKTAY